MKHVLIAGATGHLGRFLCREFQSRGWHVTALRRKCSSPVDLAADRILEAEATWPETLTGAMAGMDLVVSALGITGQVEGPGYWDVDYQANVNLLEAALRSQVARFAYLHVLNADRMEHVPRVAAKAAFVRKLQNAGLRSTVIAPTAAFTAPGALLDRARAGRVWIFGHGGQRINPIHGADLASATCDSIEEGAAWADIGGPESFTRLDLARLCFDALGRSPRITHLPEMLRPLARGALARLAPRRIAGPLQYDLASSAINMTAPPRGAHRLGPYLRQLADQR